MNLGDVPAGTIVRSISFGIENAAAPGSDILAVTSDQAGDTAFRVFGAPNGPDYANISPASAHGSTVIAIDTDQPGPHVETITLHPVGVAPDGTATPLPDQTVTISFNVVGTLDDVSTIPSDAFSATLSVPNPAQFVDSTPISLGGEHFARIENLGSWFAGQSLDFAPTADGIASYGPNYLFAVFQQLHLDLTAGGPAVHDVDVVGGKAGELLLGDGDHHVVWDFASDAPGDGNTARIQTGAGQDDILLTAVGLPGDSLHNLADQLAPSSILPYAIYPDSRIRDGSIYSGSNSRAVVDAGPGDDKITIDGQVSVTINLKSGDGDDTVAGFVSGSDQIHFDGIDPVTVSSAPAEVSGQSGLLISYGNAGDSVFLAGISVIGDGDLTYANTPGTPPMQGVGVPDLSHPDPNNPASVDWNYIASVVTEHWQQTGQWVPYDQLIA